ncbi:protein lifeguard 2-like [Tropilaelaps mercedesae]|uniref:Protein lifeguard 2-like n=1 Tax=Tropilaelaps mercedesae TaxID=418985 RepID=A0A1V9Y3H1_9ACAR|nr:protein lifeguard 2-like [Tropilaelaps mercedesae]
MTHLCNADNRNGFLRGVYLIMSIQFAIIMLSALFALLNRGLRTSLQNNIEVFIMMSVSLLVIVAIGTCFMLHRRVPWNAPMLGVFTVGYCLLMATISAASESYGAVFVFGTLAALCLLIALISCVKEWNPLST